MAIKPTIGRQVWFFPNEQDVEDGVDFRGQPLAATVVYVHNDLFLNLQVLDAVGQAWLFEEVPLFQTDKPWDYKDRAAQWMPYQRAQAEGNVYQRYDTDKQPGIQSQKNG